jgi:hypothetical protein
MKKGREEMGMRGEGRSVSRPFCSSRRDGKSHAQMLKGISTDNSSMRLGLRSVRADHLLCSVDYGARVEGKDSSASVLVLDFPTRIPPSFLPGPIVCSISRSLHSVPRLQKYP